MYSPAILAINRSHTDEHILLHEGIFYNDADEAYEKAKKALEKDKESVLQFFMDPVAVITTLEDEIDLTKYKVIKNFSTTVSDKKVLIPV